MKYLRLDLLTLLISLFIFSSCQKSENVALNIDSEDLTKSKLVDTSTIFTSTVKDADSLFTVGLSQHPFGYFKDPVFGTTEANLAFTLALPSENLTFGTNPELDSAVLVLKYGDEFYGDSLTSNYSVKVHQLTEKYNTDINYSNKKEWNYNLTAIGSKIVKSFPWRDSTQVKQKIDGSAATNKTIAPHLRIPIDASFINSNFINGSSANFANSTAFRNFIKGLYLTIDKNASSGNGGITFFNLAALDFSRLEIYYRNVTSANKPDTNMFAFPISSNTTAANIKHDYTGTPVAEKLNQASDIVYVQGLGGLRAKLNLPYLRNLKKEGDIAVNKAELVVSIVGGTDSGFKPAQRVVLYRTDIAGQRQIVPDFTPSVVGALYDKSKKRYIFNISTYVQNILNNKLEPYDLYIAPIDYSAGTTNPNINPSGTTAQRSVLGGKDNPGYKIKLNVYYTKPE